MRRVRRPDRDRRPDRQSSPRAPLIAGTVLAAALTLAYANHFDNGFHFDDAHTVVENVWIYDLGNAGAFFTNPETISTLPPNRQYRPLVTLSLAVDYWLGGGLEPFWFHASTFLWYLAQLALMFVLVRRIFESAEPARTHAWLALFCVAWYGFHAANAETINYVIARSDALSTCAVVATLAIYAAARGAARYTLIVPVVLGGLFKPTAAMAAPLLGLYVWLVQHRGDFGAAVRDRASVTITAVTALFAFGTLGFVVWMTPETFTPGGVSRFRYAITQPLVVLHYTGNFLLPISLSADTDWEPVASPGDPRVWVGFAFVGALLVAAWRASRQPRTTPIAFGLLWFLVALTPTSSVIPLAEVLNDHRTFFPFVGLTIAATWALGLALRRISALWPNSARPAVMATFAAALIAAHAYGTYRRNKVWHDGASLWYDVTLKNPRNGRGLMNYGLSQMQLGNHDRALEYFNRALEFTPRYAYLHTNLAVLWNGKGERDLAEEHFRLGILYRPDLAQGYLHYGRVLREWGNFSEAREKLERALSLSPGLLATRYELMELYQDLGAHEALARLAKDTLERVPGDVRARAALEVAERGETRLQLAERLAREAPTPERWLDISLQYYRAGRHAEALTAAQEALALRPDYGAAYNNMAAAQLELGDWAEAVENATHALALQPGFELARNNLARASQLLDARTRGAESTEESVLLDLSLFFYREGMYQEMIPICERALEINPRSVIAYNNLCSAYNGLGRWDDAIAACARALAVDPEHELAANNLAFARREQARATPWPPTPDPVR